MALKIIHAEKAYIIVDSESQEQPRLDLMRIVVQLRAELIQAREELTLNAKMLARQCDLARDAEIERDALARECNQPEEDREYNAQLVEELDVKLAQAHVNLAQALNERDEAEADYVLAAEKAVRTQQELGRERQITEGLKRKLAKTEAKYLHWFGIAQKRAWRQATLDAAEATLANCEIAGIYDTFDGLPDAIEQMSSHIRELGEQLEAERALMPEVERELKRELKQRQRQIDLLSNAEKAEYQSRRQAERRAENAEQHAERAEALAALVTEETAALMEWLANNILHTSNCPEPENMHGRDARALAARIREALETDDETR